MGVPHACCLAHTSSLPLSLGYSPAAKDKIVTQNMASIIYMYAS